MSFLVLLGEQVRDGLLGVASLLKFEFMPGLVALALFAVMVVLLLRLTMRTMRRVSVLAILRHRIDALGSEDDLAREVLAIDGEVSEWSGGAAERRAVAAAWEEYRETVISTDDSGGPVLRSTMRPALFFNVEDLSFGPGYFRIVPSLFVSIGLFLTFLGLIAALDDMGRSMTSEATGAATAALASLLGIASAKFIMSLTGLGCSIVLTAAVRRSMSRVDSAVHGLCQALERRLSFLSLEDIALRQLRTTRNQVEEFRKIGTELVAELGRPLREELPQAISASISTAMGPLVDSLMRTSSSGIEGMVGSLSDQLSGSVGAALGEAAERLAQASDRMGGLVDRMEQGSSRMGQGMEDAVAGLAGAVAGLRNQAEETARVTANTMEKGSGRMLSAMTEAVRDLRDSSGSGSQALREAAADLLAASQGIRADMSDASREGAEAVRARMGVISDEAAGAVQSVGTDLVRAMGAAGADIQRYGQELSSGIGAEIIGRIEGIAAQFEQMQVALSQVVAEVGRLATNVRTGADGVGQAADSFGRASRDLTEATQPVRESHARIEGALRTVEGSARETARVIQIASEQVRGDAVQTLAAAREALGTEREGVAATLATLEQAMAAMRDQGERIDSIDEKLGRAFEQYRSHVEGALASAVKHAQEMTSILNPGIATLQQVVEQAEEFRPRARTA